MSGKSYQEIEIIGFLGKDPDAKYTPNGKAVTTFSVAVDSDYTDASTNKKVETTCWWRVTAWNITAENCGKYLKKGDLVMVKGRPTFDPKTGGPRIWAGQDNVARASFEMSATVVRFLSNKDGASVPAQSPEEDRPNDDIPF